MTNKVVFGIVQPGMVETEMMDSLLSTIIHDQRRHIIGKLLRFSSANISRARNRIVRDFLINFPQADWLWMIDSDMSWAPDALDKLLEVAHPDKAPIVSGLCFQDHVHSMDAVYRKTSTIKPTMFQIADGELTQVEEIPENAMVQVAATGTAFLLAHRGVLEKMAAEYDEPTPWFQETVHNGILYGEDVTFCLRAGGMGTPIYVHTGINVGHKKTRILSLEDYAAT